MSDRTQVIGRLTADPVLHQTQGRRAMAYMRVAETPQVGGVWQKDQTTFHTVVTFGGSAVNASQSLHSGDMVVALGREVQRPWTPTQGEHAGKEVMRPEFQAAIVAADLRLATVAITRVAPERARSARPEDASSHAEVAGA